MNTLTKRESVSQQGSTLGQSVVGPSFLDATFHRTQARLKSSPTAGIWAESSRPLFTGLDAKDNKQRRSEYEQRKAQYAGVSA